jgi:hypothetical protein
MKHELVSSLTPYPELNTVLGVLVERLQQVLTDALVGVYLQGSFALSDYDEHSDVDFIVVIQEELSAVQVQALQAMHEQVYCLEPHWAQVLEGSYFPKDILRDYTRSGTKLWYLDNGARSLIEASHCNTAVVRWTICERGVTLAGPPPRTLIDPIPVDALRKEIRGAIHYWGNDFVTNPAPYHNRFYQGFLVLNFSRMLHDLRTGYPGSKRAGADWAKANLDPSWAPLIDRAWDCRPDPAWSVRQPPDPQDFQSTIEYVRYLIEQSRSVPVES